MRIFIEFIDVNGGAQFVEQLERAVKIIKEVPYIIDEMQVDASLSLLSDSEVFIGRTE